jgi:hypothetical protein
MTLPEEKAAQAWAIVLDHAMPPRLALDFLQTAGVDRGQAAEALLVAAVAYMANARPTAGQSSGGSFADCRAGEIGGAILVRKFDLADEWLRGLTRWLLNTEPTAPVGAMNSLWLDWCDHAERALVLCRAMTIAEARP